MSRPMEPLDRCLTIKSRPPHLFQFLTQAEFKLVFALTLVQNSSDFPEVYYDSAAWATPGSSDDANWVEYFRRTTRWLGVEKRFEFQGLTPHEDGSIDGHAVVQPENHIYVDLMRQGGLPDIPLALETAIQMIAEKGLAISIEPLRATLAGVHEHIRQRRKLVNKEALAGVDELRRRALEEVGVYVVEEGDVN